MEDASKNYCRLELEGEHERDGARIATDSESFNGLPPDDAGDDVDLTECEPVLFAQQEVHNLVMSEDQEEVNVVLDEEVERGLHEGLAGGRRSLGLSPSRHAERLPDKYIDVCIILTPRPPLL